MVVAESIAWKFAAGGGEVDDLRQVAYVGLIKASRRFDPARGVDFLSFAVPTITGELKRHVRDHGYFVRPPRRVQELRNRTLRAREQLRHTLQREPSCADLARFLQTPPAQVQEALALATRPAPLEEAQGNRAPTADDSTTRDRFELLTILAPALRRLPSRERHILYLRFFKELTQQQIARTVGVSQVHVSRLITETLSDLREALSGTHAPGRAEQRGAEGRAA